MLNYLASIVSVYVVIHLQIANALISTNRPHLGNIELYMNNTDFRTLNDDSYNCKVWFDWLNPDTGFHESMMPAISDYCRIGMTTWWGIELD